MARNTPAKPVTDTRFLAVNATRTNACLGEDTRKTEINANFRKLRLETAS
jgi:type IV secretory pathway ATPase VirB11/archaellum biosynthesis ATPase